MKKIIFISILFFIGNMYINAETWKQFKNRVEVMSERVAVPKYFDGDGWLDNLAAVIATHDWCGKAYKSILENDNSMNQGERARKQLSLIFHEDRFEYFWDIGTRLSRNNWDYVYRRYNYWFEYLNNGGWITFRDMR